MKKIALAAALSVAASTSFAGTPAAPAMEPEIIVEEAATSSSSGGILIPLLLIVLLAAAASS
ncbi:MAG: hypothetical protein ACC631_00465 [Halocynthiibacter sp.]